MQRAVAKALAQRWLILRNVSLERDRQDALKAAGKFKLNCADVEMTNGAKVMVVGEEFGEVCTAALNRTGITDDGPERSNLRKELIELAATAVAWVEALDKEAVTHGPDRA